MLLIIVFAFTFLLRCGYCVLLVLFENKILSIMSFDVRVCERVADQFCLRCFCLKLLSSNSFKVAPIEHVDNQFL